MKPTRVADTASDAEVAIGSARLALKAAEDANDAKVNAEHAALTAAKQARDATPPPPDPRVGPHFDLLRRDDNGVFARMSPRRNRWPELEQIDGRIADVDQQQAQASTELQQTQERRREADSLHQVTLADWFAEGQPDPRPVSEAGVLDDRIAALQAEHAAFDITRARLFEERVAFVVRRRKALVRDAEKATQERLARCLALVDELEQAREDVAALRQSTIWARIYPSEALASEPPFGHALVGARLSLQEKHLPGNKAMLPARSIFELLRADAEHCASALSIDQAAEIQGTTKTAISGREARWHDRNTEHEIERREKEQARRRFREEWGQDPPEFK